MRLSPSAALLAFLPVAAQAEVPAVVADTPVVHSLVGEVMGDLGTPELLVSGGADPHDYQLRPSQARALANAGAIFWVGPEMTPWLNDVVATSGAGDKVVLLDLPGTHLRDFGAGDEPDEGRDSHAWLDPGNARIWLGAIAETLATRDPDNATAYRANAEAATQALDRLDADLKARLAGVAGGIVVAHDAYGYFADHYGLTVVASLAGGDAAQPGAAHLSEVAALVRDGGATCVFPETGHDPKPAVALAGETGIKVGEALDPEGLGMAPGQGLYAALMTALAEKIAACAG
ncbi:MAG: zinc ABC transporter substrate-binding protein [Proteobacteria bacterium]|nr:zinc ABC transporter substrate-binding protein [Pseudomonadota bacterium]